MGNFSNNSITDKGRLLLADVQAGAVFTPTRIVIGSGNLPNTVTTQNITDVIAPVKSLAINKKKRTPDGKCTFGGAYSNNDITEAFYFRELALYAKAVYLNNDGSVKSEVAEVLYSYGNAGATADYMPAYSTSTVVEKQIDLVVWIGNNAKVDLTVESGIYVTREDFDNEAVKKTGDVMTGTLEALGFLIASGRIGGLIYENGKGLTIRAGDASTGEYGYFTLQKDAAYFGNAKMFHEGYVPTPEFIGASRKAGYGWLPDGSDINALPDGGNNWYMLIPDYTYRNAPADFEGWGVLIVHDKAAMLHQINTGVIYYASNIGTSPVQWGKIYNTHNKPTPAEIGVAPAVEDSSYPGCYYRMVDGVKEWINPPMAINAEYRTTERFKQYPVWTSIQSVKATYEIGGRCYCDTNIDATNFNLIELRRHDPSRLTCYTTTYGEKVSLVVENLGETDMNGTWFKVQLWYTKSTDTPTGGFG